MSKYKQFQTSDFRVEGRFLGFAAQKGYKLKYLRLSTAQEEFWIKLPKELRSSLYRTLTPGDWIQVLGERKIDGIKGTVKFKAYDVALSSPERTASTTSAETPANPIAASPCASEAVEPGKTKKAASILVCQKSDCCKRGGRALLQALQSTLNERGLTDVAIKPTGCMKQCKAGPNLIMPDKTRYCRIQADEVATLVDKHFPTPATSTVA